MIRYSLIILFSCLWGCQNSSSPDTFSGTDTTIKTPTLSLDSSSKKDSEIKIDTSISPVVKNLYLVNANITYNADFEPILTAEIKNNLDKTVIAFELEIGIQSYCDIPTIRKRARLLPGKSLVIHQRIEIQNGCTINASNISIGDYILSDGTKRNPGDLYIKRRETWKK